MQLMVKSENLRSEFERIVTESSNKVWFLFHFVPVRTFGIEITKSGDKGVFISLYVFPSDGKTLPFIVARSYSMPFKSAYRLVCSL